MKKLTRGSLLFGEVHIGHPILTVVPLSGDPVEDRDIADPEEMARLVIARVTGLDKAWREGGALQTAPHPSGDEIVAALAKSVWSRVSPGRVPDHNLHGKAGIVAETERIEVTLWYPKKDYASAADALRQLQTDEPDIHPAVIGAFWLADRLLKQWAAPLENRRLSTFARVGAVIAEYVDVLREIWRNTPVEDYARRTDLTASQIERVVLLCCEAVLKPEAVMQALTPLNGLTLIKTLWRFSQMLWDVHTIARFRQDPDDNTFLMPTWYLSLAAGYGLTVDEGISYHGVQLHIGDRLAAAFAWSQLDHFYAGHLSREALDFFLPDHRFPAWYKPEDFPPHVQETFDDSEAMVALARRLREECELHKRYSPEGPCVIDLPESVPLRRIGICALKLWWEIDGLWVQPVRRGNRPCQVFRWTPGKEGSTVVDIRTHWPLYDVTLSALWHDGHSAGAKSIVKKGSFVIPQETAEKPAKGERRKAKYDGVKVWPRTPIETVEFTGPREWGSDLERHTIARSAHRVVSHLRELPSDWKPRNAGERARELGLVLPEGNYTVVRGYVSGKGDPGEHIPKIYSIGLMSLTAWLKKEKEK